jgi:hypothetical protein
MKTIVFLSCTKSKLNHPAPAKDLYSASPMFKKTYEYSKLLKPDETYILSAKHHLVPLNKVLKPYDKTLKEMPSAEKEKWGEETIKQMKAKNIDFQKDKFIFLTGNEYLKSFIPLIPAKNVIMPMAGKRFGERLKWLNNQLINLKEFIIKIKTLIYEYLRK